MVTLGKKRNKPSLEARMRGLATQARKVELAEPAIRAHHATMQRMSPSNQNQSYDGTMYPPTLAQLNAPPERSSTGPRKSKKQPQMAQTARSERSVMSDGAPKRRTLVL